MPSSFVNQCEKCRRYASFIHTSSNLFHSVISPWSFYKWRVEILGKFPLALSQLKFMLVQVDYFTKWMGAKAVAKIQAERVRHFYWRNIICCFGLPKPIIYDNGTQFSRSTIREFYVNLGNQRNFMLVEHPQTNGQVEAANKVILSDMKKKLDKDRGLWVEKL